MSTLPRFDGPTNMAADTRLLAQAELGQPSWRVYGWEGPWVSLGCFQRPEAALRRPEEIAWVMRPTGGKAVLHGHDVTVGLALPLSLLGDDPERLARSIKGVYRHAIAPIVSALRECGLPAILAESLPLSSRERGSGGEGASPLGSEEDALTLALSRGERGSGGHRTADCFAFTSPNDIVHESTGEKVCGCALKLTRTAVLVQASIPAGEPLIDPSEVFERPAILRTTDWESNRFEEAFQSSIRELERGELAR